MQIILPDIFKPFPLSQQPLQSRQRGGKELYPSVVYLISSHKRCPAQRRSSHLHDSQQPYAAPCTDGAHLMSGHLLSFTPEQPFWNWWIATTFFEVIAHAFLSELLLSNVQSLYSRNVTKCLLSPLAVADLPRLCKFTLSRDPDALQNLLLSPFIVPDANCITVTFFP